MQRGSRQNRAGAVERLAGKQISQGSFCTLCGAWRGCLGLEPTPELYVEHMVEVFREVKRVLRDDGVLFMNLGDCYYSQGVRKHGDWAASGTCPQEGIYSGNLAKHSVLKPKDLVGIPWRVAFALQADGWWLRSDIIWHKPNPMPESVTDRPTKSHEYLFLLTKNKRYFYDADAVREAISNSTIKRWHGDPYTPRQNKGYIPWGSSARNPDTHVGEQNMGCNPAGRNRRTVWTIPTRPYSGAHFATYPPALVEPCILAGTSAKGACPECGGPWERVVEKGLTAHDGATESAYAKGTTANRLALLRQAARERGEEYTSRKRTTGWRPTCSCGHATTKSCLVLDPFCGSGTTGMVAVKHGRDFVGMDLSGEYLHQLATERLSKIQVSLF